MAIPEAIRVTNVCFEVLALEVVALEILPLELFRRMNFIVVTIVMAAIHSRVRNSHILSHILRYGTVSLMSCKAP